MANNDEGSVRGRYGGHVKVWARTAQFTPGWPPSYEAVQLEIHPVGGRARAELILELDAARELILVLGVAIARAEAYRSERHQRK